MRVISFEAAAPPTGLAAAAEFHPAEYLARYQAARALMQQAGLDALLVTSQRNYIYYTGHSGTETVPHWMWSLSDARPFLAVLPRRGEPFLVLHRIAAGFAHDCWIKQRHVFGEEPFRAEFLIAALQEFGLTAGVIGCEFGEEQRLGLPLAEFRRVQQALPQVEWVDAAGIFWEQRAYKSPAEIARLREANRITVRLIQQFAAEARIGMTMREADVLLSKLALDEGADYLPLNLFIVTGPNGAAHFPPDGRRRFQPGDLMWLDIGAQYRGYTADINRMVHFGAPPLPVQRQAALAVELGAYLSGLMQPGARLGDVRARLDDRYRSLDLPVRGGRHGHGIGMTPTEAPSLVVTSPVVLRPGMTITSEPVFETPDGYRWSVEDALLITATGNENLTPMPLDLLVVER